MKIVEVQFNQNIFDIATQVTGINDNAYIIARFNQLSITESLKPGSRISIPDGLSTDVKVLQYLQESGNQTPATGSEQLNADQSGIGYWAIGLDFIVS